MIRGQKTGNLLDSAAVPAISGPTKEPGARTMSSQVPVLKRTAYTDPSDTTNAAPNRIGAVQDNETYEDFMDYAKPLEQIHGSNLHGWGIASG